MLTDEEIERRRAAMEPLLGSTKANWYAEACKVEYSEPHDKVLWTCRYREAAMEAAELAEIVVLLWKCRGTNAWLHMTQRQRDTLRLLTPTEDAP